MSDKYVPVVFEDSEGNTISNDPVYRAQQTLAAAGVSFAESQPEQLATNARAADDVDLGDDDAEDYKAFDGTELKAMADERGVDRKGLKTVGELRQALISADEAAAQVVATEASEDE